VTSANVELARRLVAAFNARDVEALVSLCDPAIEYRSAAERALGGGVYHGHDGIRQWQRDLEESWGKEIGVEPEAYFDLGEHTLIYYVLHARGTQSGAEVAMPIAAVARWQSDLLVYSEAYFDRAGALRALGATKDELALIAP
jgi:ketosteroid isomerase-like protein